jgi:hypothetical protein
MPDPQGNRNRQECQAIIGAKVLMERVMGHRRNNSRQSRQPMPDDLKDWATIGLIIVSSSLLVWGPILVG